MRTLAVAAAVLLGAVPFEPPAPGVATPSPRQLRWHALDTYAFLHFSPNTFTDKEWGYGDEDPALFNPTAFDADQIVGALERGGMTGVILTAKHHDGFCLWPTKTTRHSVAASPWKGGKGDVVREIADAARRRGLRFGVYLSPWDRNHPAYGTPAYVAVYRAQLRELLTDYGPIFEVWHDGANGGDGYYGGARETRRIDRRTYYDWPRTWALVRELQPDAVIFSDVGPDVRWVGNEKGIAGETNWAAFEPVGLEGDAPAPGYVKSQEGQRGAARWIPAECDVSIRPGWFFHEKENGRVRSVDDLFDLYLKSVGRGCNLLLNVPPDRRGLLHETDVAALAGFHDRVRRTFATDLARGSRVAASSAGRDEAGSHDGAMLVDGRRETFWMAAAGRTRAEILLDLPREARFSYIRLREHIALGQRIAAFAVDRWTGTAWEEMTSGTTIGPTRILPLSTPASTTRVRLRILDADAPPALAELALF